MNPGPFSTLLNPLTICLEIIHPVQLWCPPPMLSCPALADSHSLFSAGTTLFGMSCDAIAIFSLKGTPMRINASFLISFSNCTVILMSADCLARPLLLSYFATQKICSAAHLVLFAWFFFSRGPGSYICNPVWGRVSSTFCRSESSNILVVSDRRGTQIVQILGSTTM